MTGLRSVVALFGRNGAGKSRLLRLLRDNLSGQKMVYTGVAERRSYPTKQPWDLTSTQRRAIQAKIPDEIADAQVREHWPTVLDNIVREYVGTEHPRHIDTDLRTKAVSRFEGIRSLVFDLMGLELEVVQFETDFCAGLFGKRLSPGVLSEGERELLMFSVRCFEQVDSLRGSYFLIDEPETHIHPGALLRLINILRRTIGEDGQLWLATHSIALLAELEREEIWVIKDGIVLPQGSRHVSEALSELVGDLDSIESLGRLALEPASWAAVKFAGQCLQEPGKTPYNHDDPQIKQFSGAAGTVLLQLELDKRLCRISDS